jgi:hypothetical protein
MCAMGKHSEDAVNAPRRNHLWILIFIAAPAAVEVWSGWIGLGSLAGFGEIRPLPGIWNGLQVNTVLTLPVGMEAYAGFALYAWLASDAGEAVRTFARRSAIGALALSCIGQVTYHLLAAAHITRAPSLVIVLAACLPVLVLSFAAALTHLMHADAMAREQAAREAAGKAAAKAAAKSGNTGQSPAATKPVTPAGAAPAAPSRPAPVTGGVPARKRTDAEWLAEVRKLHADQGSALTVRKLMPQLKLLGGGSGIAIGKATKMLARVKAESGGTETAEAVG